MRRNQLRIDSLFLLIALVFGALPLVAQDEAVECEEDADYGERAQAAVVAEEFDAAIDAYTCLIERDAEDYEAYLGRAIAALLAGVENADFSFNALGDLDQVAAGAPELIDETIARQTAEIAARADEVSPYALRGYFYLYLRQVDRAILDFDRVISLNPDSQFGYLYRGISNLLLANDAKAASDFRQVADGEIDNPSVLALIGAIYTERQQGEEALEYLDQAIALDASNPEFYSYRAFANTLVEDFAAAEADYTAAINLDPENADYYAGRAYIYSLMGRSDRVIADLTEALDRAPDYQLGWQQRGWAYVQTEEFEAAVDDFDEAVQLDPTDRWSFLGRATSYQGLGETERAAGDFALYVALNAAEVVDGDPLRVGREVTVSMSEGLVFQLPFSADEGDKITISAVSPDGSVDPLLVLLDPEGSPLIGSDDTDAANLDFNASVEAFEAPEDGDYLLLVTHAGGGSEGRVQVLVEAADK